MAIGAWVLGRQPGCQWPPGSLGSDSRPKDAFKLLRSRSIETFGNWQDYLKPIFQHALGPDDLEYQRRSTFATGNLMLPYHSVNTDISKRIRYIC